jgi:RimJ/RimL family protein N-acetyltransferase
MLRGPFFRSSKMSDGVVLRELRDEDLAVIFEHERDPAAIHMAAFTAKDPEDREAFDAHWVKVRADGSVTLRAILLDGVVVGHVVCHSWCGFPEVSYWIAREHWGKGVATAALAAFLEEVTVRPIFARVVKDNAASIRVLEKCGYVVSGHDRGFANGRGREVDELVMKLAR